MAASSTAGPAPALAVGLSVLLGGCGSDEPVGYESQAVFGSSLSGGDTTVEDASPNAFGFSARNMTSERRGDFFVGNSFFKQNWVEAPASTTGRDGLGPLFNARSCSTCHFKDGRGTPPQPGQPSESILFRVSVVGTGPHGGPKDHPAYGGQLQPRALPGVSPEGDVRITWQPRWVELAGGENVELRAPEFEWLDLGYGPPNGLLMSARVAPQMIGLGLLEAIDEATLTSWEDPNDVDGDGVRGVMNAVWDAQAAEMRVGRFGWKANQPNLRQQTAGALLGDMGLTTSVFTNQNCGAQQPECAAKLSGGKPEVSALILDTMVFYSSTLAVPARRDVDSPVNLQGEQLFEAIGCATCHRSTVRTGVHPTLPEVSEQLIHPYTDLLLHDMGDELADGRPDFKASGRQWRTPPLWGIGLFGTVSRHTNYLHDGRARNIQEAILWHGGEGKASRDMYAKLGRNDRAALLSFLESL